MKRNYSLAMIIPSLIATSRAFAFDLNVIEPDATAYADQEERRRDVASCDEALKALPAKAKVDRSVTVSSIIAILSREARPTSYEEELRVTVMAKRIQACLVERIECGGRGD